MTHMNAIGFYRVALLGHGGDLLFKKNPFFLFFGGSLVCQSFIFFFFFSLSFGRKGGLVLGKVGGGRALNMPCNAPIAQVLLLLMPQQLCRTLLY